MLLENLALPKHLVYVGSLRNMMNMRFLKIRAYLRKN